jgi:hypothetical protein
MMVKEEVLGRTMAKSAATAFEAGLITAEERDYQSTRSAIGEE